MGAGWSSWLGSWWQRQVRVLMLGLDGAGKTTVLYQLKLGAHISTIPTVGFNCGMHMSTTEFACDCLLIPWTIPWHGHHTYVQCAPCTIQFARMYRSSCSSFSCPIPRACTVWSVAVYGVGCWGTGCTARFMAPFLQRYRHYYLHH